MWTEFRFRRGREAKGYSEMLGGRGLMMRGVQSVRVSFGGGRLDGVGGRLCDDDGCDLSIGSSQSTPVYQLSLVPPPACPSVLSVCLSFMPFLSLAVWLPCWARRLGRQVLVPTASKQYLGSVPQVCQASPAPDLVTDARRSESPARSPYVSPARPFPVWSCFRLQVSVRSFNAA